MKADSSLPPDAADLITEKDLAARASISTAMLQKLRREGRGPTFVRIGKAVRYRQSDARAWLASLTAK